MAGTQTDAEDEAAAVPSSDPPTSETNAERAEEPEEPEDEVKSAEPEAKPKTGSKSESGSKPRPKSGPKTGSKTEPKAAPEAGSDPEASEPKGSGGGSASGAKPKGTSRTKPTTSSVRSKSASAASSTAKSKPASAASSKGGSKTTPAGGGKRPSGGARTRPRRRLPRISDPVTTVAVVVVVIAAVCAGWFGWSWYAAAHDDSLGFSRTRNAVLRAGEQAVQNMNTLDYRKLDQGLSTWKNSTTGDLRKQITRGWSGFEQQVTKAETVTTAKILDGAITELDERVGKARMIVAVQITVDPADGKSTTKRSRMRAELTRTASGWKLSALGQAPVAGAGAGSTRQSGQ